MKSKIQSLELTLAAYSEKRAGDVEAIRKVLLQKMGTLNELDEEILGWSLELDENELHDMKRRFQQQILGKT